MGGGNSKSDMGGGSNGSGAIICLCDGGAAALSLTKKTRVSV